MSSESRQDFLNDFFVEKEKQHAATKCLAKINDALAESDLDQSERLTRKRLVQHTLSQIGSLLHTRVVEFWNYDWTRGIAMPESVLLSSQIPVPSSVHPCAFGIPLPESLILANRRPRRRKRVYVSTFDEQPDVDEALFEYYRSLTKCDQFIHFPLLKSGVIVSAIIAISHQNNRSDALTIEFAHLLTNRLSSNLLVAERVDSQATASANLNSDFDLRDTSSIVADVLQHPVEQRRKRLDDICGNDKAMSLKVLRLLAEQDAEIDSQPELLNGATNTTTGSKTAQRTETDSPKEGSNLNFVALALVVVCGLGMLLLLLKLFGFL